METNSLKYDFVAVVAKIGPGTQSAQIDEAVRVSGGGGSAGGGSAGGGSLGGDSSE